MLKWLKIAIYNSSIVNPYELAVSVSFLLVGLAFLFVPIIGYPVSITTLFPEGFRVMWGVLVTLSGLLKTTGILAGNISWRRAGLILLSGVSAVFVIAILSTSTTSFAFTGGIFAAICIASVVQFRRLG